MPKFIRVDNGPEFISDRLDSWCKLNKIQLIIIQPYVFKSIKEVREVTEEWMFDYNNNRPHSALNNKTPAEYAMKIDGG